MSPAAIRVSLQTSSDGVKNNLHLWTETTLSLQRMLQLLQSCQLAHPVHINKSYHKAIQLSK